MFLAVVGAACLAAPFGRTQSSSGASSIPADLGGCLHLVDNAPHHSPARATLCLHARAAIEGVEIAVCDEGRGVPAHLRERMFAAVSGREECADGIAGGAPEDETSGGHGLAFCRQVVEGHGGTIWVEENEPRGSRFCFWLPAVTSSAA